MSILCLCTALCETRSYKFRIMQVDIVICTDCTIRLKLTRQQRISVTLNVTPEYEQDLHTNYVIAEKNSAF